MGWTDRTYKRCNDGIYLIRRIKFVFLYEAVILFDNRITINTSATFYDIIRTSSSTDQLTEGEEHCDWLTVTEIQNTFCIFFFYVHVTVHPNKFLYNKTNEMH